MPKFITQIAGIIVGIILILFFLAPIALPLVACMKYWLGIAQAYNLENEWLLIVPIIASAGLIVICIMKTALDVVVNSARFAPLGVFFRIAILACAMSADTLCFYGGICAIILLIVYNFIPLIAREK